MTRARDLTLDLLFAVVVLAAAPLWVPWWAWRRRQGHALPLVILALALTGCGASALDRATTTLGAAHALQSGAVSTVRSEVRDDLRAACAGETTPDAVDACVAERAERWRAAEAGLDVSALALDEAGAELLAWAEDGDPDAAPRGACQRLVAAVEAVAHVLRLLDALGVRLPDGLPSWTCGGE